MNWMQEGQIIKSTTSGSYGSLGDRKPKMPSGLVGKILSVTQINKQSQEVDILGIDGVSYQRLYNPKVNICLIRLENYTEEEFLLNLTINQIKNEIK